MSQTRGKRGGSRPGAGRKPNLERQARPVALALDRIGDNLPFLIDQMLSLASGIKCADDDEVYSTPPDRQALIYLIDRVMGKPRQAVEHSGPEGEPFKVYLDVDMSMI